MHVLVIEDDPKIAGVIADSLRREGHAVAWRQDGEAGLCDALEADPLRRPFFLSQAES